MTQIAELRLLIAISDRSAAFFFLPRDLKVESTMCSRVIFTFTNDILRDGIELFYIRMIDKKISFMDLFITPNLLL